MILALICIGLPCFILACSLLECHEHHARLDRTKHDLTRSTPGNASNK